MNPRLKVVLERAEAWPVADQIALVEAAEQIEILHRGRYEATPDELRAIDEADASGLVSDEEIEEAFKKFHRERKTNKF